MRASLSVDIDVRTLGNVLASLASALESPRVVRFSATLDGYTVMDGTGVGRWVEFRGHGEAHAIGAVKKREPGTVAVVVATSEELTNKGE